MVGLRAGWVFPDRPSAPSESTEGQTSRLGPRTAGPLLCTPHSGLGAVGAHCSLTAGIGFKRQPSGVTVTF